MYQTAANGVIVRANEDGTTAYIPPDDTNPDYHVYLEWVAEGNEAPVRPEPAPEPVADPDAEQAELDAAITAATTLTDLKKALLGSRGGRVKARPGA